jgi:hypothetical protein
MTDDNWHDPLVQFDRKLDKPMADWSGTMAEPMDNNLLDLWLHANRLPPMTVQALIEEVDYLRKLCLENYQTDTDWPVYPVPTLETTRD